jgi:hypothetical protein
MGAPPYRRFGFVEIDRSLAIEREKVPPEASVRCLDRSAFERLVGQRKTGSLENRRTRNSPNDSSRAGLV